MKVYPSYEEYLVLLLQMPITNAYYKCLLQMPITNAYYKCLVLFSFCQFTPEVHTKVQKENFLT